MPGSLTVGTKPGQIFANYYSAARAVFTSNSCGLILDCCC